MCFLFISLFYDKIVSVCVLTSIHRENFICLEQLNSSNVSEQINDAVLKTCIFSAKSLSRYFRMKLWAFLTRHFVFFTH